jgi:hypothetical protein
VDEAVWVELGQVYSYVERANPGAPLAEIQAEPVAIEAKLNQATDTSTG